MAKICEKTWIMEIRPAVTVTFSELCFSVLALLTDATNLNIIQTHRPMSTMFLYRWYAFVRKGI